MGSANFGHEGGVLSDIFIAITNNTNRALVLFVYGKFSRQIINSLETKVGRLITLLAQHMPLLGKYRMDSCLLNLGFTTIVKTIKYQLSLCLDF
jgi:hypothetical protein